MASNETSKTTPTPSAFYHALLRPAILQILRAQGYYGCSPAVLDTVTELASQYMSELARSSAFFAERNNSVYSRYEVGDGSSPATLTDVRMALEECGALWPQRDPTAQLWREKDPEVKDEDKEDMQGVEAFVGWAKGKKNAKIRKVITALQQTSTLEGVDEPVTDYLSALKKKHNKTDLDSKYAGTVLGKGLDHGEVMVEGGEVSSIEDWAKAMREASTKSPEDPDSRPPSSGLSSLTDGDIEMMDLP